MNLLEENEFPLLEIGRQLSFQIDENAIVTSLTPPRKGHHLGKKMKTTNIG